MVETCLMAPSQRTRRRPTNPFSLHCLPVLGFSPRKKKNLTPISLNRTFSWNKTHAGCRCMLRAGPLLHNTCALHFKSSEFTTTVSLRGRFQGKGSKAEQYRKCFGRDCFGIREVLKLRQLLVPACKLERVRTPA